MKKILMVLPALALLASCVDDATVATENVKKAGNNFEILRRVVFYNGITNDYILEVIGKCSFDLSSNSEAFSMICKDQNGDFKRHTLVRSDNVTAFVEQLDGAKVSTSFYRVTFKPSVIVPAIELR